MRWPRLVAPFAASTSVECSVDAEGIDEDGAPVMAATWEGEASWQDTAMTVYQPGKESVDVTACVYADGDILPGVAHITGGTVSALGGQRRIVRGCKARNPDGTVNYTRLDLK